MTLISPPSAVPFRIGWMRNTSSHPAKVGSHTLPAAPIFHTRPCPVPPSESHRWPSRSKATPFAPGTPVAKAVAVGGMASSGVKLQTLALALSATNRSPVSFNAMPRGLQGVGSLPTNTKVGLERLMRQTGQNVSPRLGIGVPPVYRFPE